MSTPPAKDRTISPGLLLAGGLAILAIYVAVSGMRRNSSQEDLGKPLPEFEVAGWLTQPPEPLKPGEQPVTVLAAMTTWCPHCAAEADELSGLYKEYHSRGVRFVAITDEPPEILPKLEKFAARHKLEFPVGYGGERVFAALQIEGIPRVFVAGPDGKIVWTNYSDGTLEGAIQEALVVDSRSNVR